MSWLPRSLNLLRTRSRFAKSYLRLPLLATPWNYSKQDFATATQQCPRCPARSSVSTGDIICGRCQQMFKPPGKDELNFFAMFDMEAQFDVDKKELNLRYKQLQSRLHPDKFASASDKDQNDAQTWSSLINKAYSTLTKPLNRGIYMLKLKGESDMDFKPNPVFLGEMMELNESVDEAETAREIEELSNENKKVVINLTNKLKNAFNEDDLVKAKEILAKIKYYDRIQQKLIAKETQAGIVH